MRSIGARPKDVEIPKRLIIKNNDRRIICNVLNLGQYGFKNVLNIIYSFLP